MDGVFDRRHPFRLDPAQYRMPRQVVSVTLCARRPCNLATAVIASRLVPVIGQMAARRSVRVHAYCVMPDHMHLVASVVEVPGDLKQWVRYSKRETARVLGARGMWQRSYWDRHARDEDSVVAMVEYLLHNPVRRQLCASWTDWPYSWSEWHPQTRGLDPNVGPDAPHSAPPGRDPV